MKSRIIFKLNFLRSNFIALFTLDLALKQKFIANKCCIMNELTHICSLPMIVAPVQRKVQLKTSPFAQRVVTESIRHNAC
jgi:hypothetical protein